MPRRHRERRLVLVQPPPANDDEPLPGVQRDIGAMLIGVLLGLAAIVVLILVLASWLL